MDRISLGAVATVAAFFLSWALPTILPANGGDMRDFGLLFVDDETDLLDTFQEFFSELGYTVSTACNGQEALLRIKETLPRAIFLDISMPHMDGTETLRLIQEIDPNIQVIIVSGYASAPMARELLQQGAFDFFQKPVDLMQLHEMVERLSTIADLS
jgi:DNA-binding NtrC family response regulator